MIVVCTSIYGVYLISSSCNLYFQPITCSIDVFSSTLRVAAAGDTGGHSDSVHGQQGRRLVHKAAPTAVHHTAEQGGARRPPAGLYGRQILDASGTTHRVMNIYINYICDIFPFNNKYNVNKTKYLSHFKSAITLVAILVGTCTIIIILIHVCGLRVRVNSYILPLISFDMT